MTEIPHIFQLVVLDDPIKLGEWLTQHPADANAHEDLYWITETPLSWAIKNCSHESIRVLLARGANVEEMDEHGFNMWEKCIMQNDAIAVQLLLAHSGPPRRVISSEVTTHLLLQDGIQILKLCIEHDVDLRTERRHPILLTAVLQHKASECFKYLMSRSPPMSQLAADGFSTFPLWHAIHMLNEEAVTRISVTPGFGNVFHHRFLDGESYLHLAVSQRASELMTAKKLAIIRVLLLHSADVNATNDLGETPIHMTWDIPTVRLLILSGADIYLRNPEGLTTYKRFEDSQPLLFLMNNLRPKRSTLVSEPTEDLSDAEK